MKYFWILITATFLLFTFVDSTLAATHSFEWHDLPYSSLENTFASGTAKTENDITLTQFAVGIDNMARGTVYDVCIYLSDEVNPSYSTFVIAGYSEIFCWNVQYNSSSGSWNTVIDLTTTPLLVSKNSSILCASSGSASTSTLFDCKIDYEDYQVGSPVYRSLRLPYSDRVIVDQNEIATSYYVSSSVFPLHVKKVAAFQSFAGDPTVSTARPCLRWIRQGGALVQERCFPLLTNSAGINVLPPAPIDLDWQIPFPDLLTATCHNTRFIFDCGLWAIVEIPPNLKLDNKTIYQDYNNVPHPFLEQYCETYVSSLNHRYFCNNQTTCDNQTKINRCIGLFPKADCLLTNSCTNSTEELNIADLDQDGDIDVSDYNILISNFGLTGILGWIRSDILKNGVVDIFDFNELISNFGT